MAVKRVEGVREAEFSYERAEGFVTFDTTKTNPQAFIAELDRMTDFSATVRAMLDRMPSPDPGGNDR